MPLTAQLDDRLHIPTRIQTDTASAAWNPHLDDPELLTDLVQISVLRCRTFDRTLTGGGRCALAARMLVLLLLHVQQLRARSALLDAAESRARMSVSKPCGWLQERTVLHHRLEDSADEGEQ